MTQKFILSLTDATLELSARTYIMGVLNVTPDSFSDGGRFMETGSRPEFSRAIEAGLKMAEDGADIIDVGGESTRPGSDEVPLLEEIARVVPVIEGIRRHSSVVISIDTYKAETARAALESGASIVNDISGAAFDTKMLSNASMAGAAVVLMHIKGSPKDMQADPRYDDVVSEVKEYLSLRAEAAVAAGIPRERILIDPGIGFGKTVAHNLELINRLDEIAQLGFPVVLGVSRKAFIGRLTGGAVASERLEGTIAANIIGITKGANILRVHDVAAVRKAVLVADAILSASVLISKQ